MKKLIFLIFMIAGATVVALAPTASAEDLGEGTGSVTGIGSGSFPGNAILGAVSLSGFEIATGIFTEHDGTAAGVFHLELKGRTILGERRITLEGNVTQGTVSQAAGASNFSGLASVDLGDGTPAVSGVPFNVETSAGSMLLTIQSTALPAAALNAGSLTIE